mgnify:CR=1 FL=1
MSDSEMRILYVLTDLVAPLVVGYFIHQRKWISDMMMNRIIRFNIIVIYTLLSLLSFWVLPIDRELAIVPFFGFFLILFPGLIGQIFFARSYPNLLDRGAYLVSAFLSNIGTLGGVCAFILYSEQGFAYSQIIATCQNVLLVLLIFPLSQYFYLKHTGGTRKSSPVRDFCNLFFSWNQICLIGMAAGLYLNLHGIARPAALTPIFAWLVHISAWFAMLPVGYLIDFRRARPYLFTTKSLYFIRFIVMPAAACLLAYFAFDSAIARNTMLIFASCPTAINAVIAARLYKLNVDLPIASFLATTTLYLLLFFPILFFILHE